MSRCSSPPACRAFFAHREHDVDTGRIELRLVFDAINMVSLLLYLCSEPSAAGTRPRAHIRRAHWHRFWTGPRDGERTPRVKWLPPIPVNVDDLDAMPAVVHPLR